MRTRVGSLSVDSCYTGQRTRQSSYVSKFMVFGDQLRS